MNNILLLISYNQNDNMTSFFKFASLSGDNSDDNRFIYILKTYVNT